MDQQVQMQRLQEGHSTHRLFLRGISKRLTIRLDVVAFYRRETQHSRHKFISCEARTTERCPHANETVRLINAIVSTVALESVETRPTAGEGAQRAEPQNGTAGYLQQEKRAVRAESTMNLTAVKSFFNITSA